MATRAEPDSTADVPLVSVIIPVRDDARGIHQVLDCLAVQTLPRDRFEVIVGDDGSRPPIASQLQASAIQVRVVSGPPRTSYAARNAAARAARGNALAFCDSDCRPEPTWLEHGLAALADADIVAGEVKFSRPVEPTVWSMLTIDLFLDQRQNVRLSRGVTANLLVRRECFDALRGFDQSLPSGGDYDFVQRAVRSGARLSHSQLAAVSHPTIDDAHAFLRKVWNTNVWDAVRRSRHKGRPDALGAFAPVPILGVAVARRRALRPAYRLDPERLEAAGIRPRLRDSILAAAALHLVVCYVAGAGRAFGRLRGRRLLREGFGPAYAFPPVEVTPAARKPEESP